MYSRVVYADFELKSGDVLRAEDLRIEFQILKTKKSEANTAEIRISNLSRDTRNLIREQDALVRLYAGYEDDLGAALIFVGNSQMIVHRFETPDIVTHIEAKDGQRTLRETRVSLAYGNRISAQALLNRLAGDLGVALRQDFAIPGFWGTALAAGLGTLSTRSPGGRTTAGRSSTGKCRFCRAMAIPEGWR